MQKHKIYLEKKNKYWKKSHFEAIFMISAIFLDLFLILHLLKQVFKLVLMKKTRNKFIPIKLQSSWQSNVYLKEYEKNKGLFCYINRCCIFIYYARKQKTNTNTKLYPSKFTPIINNVSSTKSAEGATPKRVVRKCYL